MKWFERLRRYIVIKTAESYYNRMMVECDELYRKTKRHHYIVIDPWRGDRIAITNRDNFRATKRAINDSGHRMAVHSMSEAVLTDATMPDVHEGCFYSTLLRKRLDTLLLHPEENGRAIRHLSNDIEARRRAYIKWALEHVRRRGLFGKWRERRTVRRELKQYKGRKAK